MQTDIRYEIQKCLLRQQDYEFISKATEFSI
jgi:hypothetical protein